MSFLSPIFLLGLPLIGIPLAIHLLNRRQHRRISWGAMQFLIPAVTRKRRLWRLNDWLLLLLRTLALVCFVAALARPLFPASWLGDRAPREYVLIVDPSLSMSRRVAGESLFDLQIARADAILDDLQPADSVRVLVAGEVPEWLTTNAVRGAAGTLGPLREQLAGLRCGEGPADLASALREALDLEPLPGKSSRILAVWSDGQRQGWRLDEQPLWESLQARLDSPVLPTAVGVQFLHPDGPGPNLSVDHLRTPRPYGALGQTLEFKATVRNHGPASSSTTLLAWEVGGVPAGVVTVPELAPGAATTLTLSHRFAGAGQSEVLCRLDAADTLPGDNEARMIVDIHTDLPILVVAPASPAGDVQADTPFLQAALGASPGRSAGAWRSVFNPTWIEPSALVDAELSRFRCVILAGTPAPDPGVVERLEDYVRSGGGLWIVPGTAMDVEAFNQVMHGGGLGLLPAPFMPAVGDPSDRRAFSFIRTTSEAHPATALLSDLQRLDLDRARVFRRHPLNVAGIRDLSVLLQTESGDPLAVECRRERGRVIVQGMPLGVAWGTLPLCQAYVALIHEWLWYLSEPGLPRRNLVSGELLVATATGPGSHAELILPDEQRRTLDAARVGGRHEFRWAATRWRGLYSVRSKDGGGGAQQEERFVVPRDPAESELAGMTAADHEQWAARKAIRLDGRIDEVAATGELEPPRSPLEGGLLTGLALFLAAEAGFAGWTSLRRNSVSPVSPLPVLGGLR